jgi:hypothetical protein
MYVSLGETTGVLDERVTGDGIEETLFGHRIRGDTGNEPNEFTIS